MLLSFFKFRRFEYLHTHSQGSFIDFVRPCIGYVKKGGARFLYKGATVFAGEGDLIYIAAGTRYYSVWSGEPEICWYSVDFSFAEPYAYYEYPFQILKNYPPDLPEAIYGAPPLKQLSLFYQLLEDLYSRMETEERTRKLQIDPAIHYIEEHYAEDFSVKDLAALCHCSESSLYKQFKRALRVSPVIYKQNIQIQQALDLLTHTDLTVEEISSRAGFASSNYFRTVFSKITGKTPGEVKNQNRR
ncbi:MAG: helix-turn-helix transcriptional regulator [Clostridia bacterium]|nr:helix-turn-helix transcriptional regulator [Clostridia bacterium]